MRITRVYTDNPLAPGCSVTLDQDISHYLGHVLRLRNDALIHLFNSRDGEFAARITAISKKAIQVQIETLLRTPEQPTPGIHLALGLSRGDRMDFAIQKSTELGVAQLSPLYTQYSEVKLNGPRAENKLRHWRKIAISAAEQSGRLEIPEIHAPLPLQDWHQTVGRGQLLMLDPRGDERLSYVDGVDRINLLAGPEGGFSEQELDWAKSSGFTIATLGTRILRTETAPLAALAVLQHLHGNL